MITKTMYVKSWRERKERTQRKARMMDAVRAAFLVLFIIARLAFITFLLTSCDAITTPDCTTVRASSYLPISANEFKLIQNGEVVGSVTTEQIYACYAAGAR
jgi:hypothetical protein